MTVPATRTGGDLDGVTAPGPWPSGQRTFAYHDSLPRAGGRDVTVNGHSHRMFCRPLGPGPGAVTNEGPWHRIPPPCLGGASEPSPSAPGAACLSGSAAPQPKVSREDLNHVLPEKGPDPWNYADLPLRTSSYACTGAGERTARTGRFV